MNLFSLKFDEMEVWILSAEPSTYLHFEKRKKDQEAKNGYFSVLILH